MGGTAVQTILGNPLIVTAIAASVGLAFGRYMHGFVGQNHKQMQPLITISVIYASIIALIWCSETAFQGSNWVSAGLTWMPQVVLLAPAIVLLIIAAGKQNRLACSISGGSIAFVVFILMGMHVSTTQSAAASNLRVMTFDVDRWSHDPSEVASTVNVARPDVFCLQQSAESYPGMKTSPLRALERALPSYRFLHEGDMTIGSTHRMRLRSVVALPPGPESSPALIATIYGYPQDFTLVSVYLMPCDVDAVKHDPSTYLDTYIHARSDQVKELLGAMTGLRSPVIVCGDFNGPPLASGMKDLTPTFGDAFVQSGMGFGFTTPAKLPLVRSDAIFTAGFSAHNVWMPKVSPVGHLPVVADLGPPPPPSASASSNSTPNY